MSGNEGRDVAELRRQARLMLSAGLVGVLAGILLVLVTGGWLWLAAGAAAGTALGTALAARPGRPGPVTSGRAAGRTRRSSPAGTSVR